MPNAKPALEVISPDTHQSTEERWLAYVKALPARGLTSVGVSAAASQFWENLTEVFSFSPPDASPSNDGGLLMSWDRNGHHLEIEILRDASYEWFYRHRAADIAEGDAVASVDEIPAKLVDRIKSLLA